MSITSILEITYKPEKVPFSKILALLLDYGWTLDDHGAITFLPPSATDVSEWQRIALDQKAVVLEAMEKKEQQGEISGVVVTWKDSKSGSTILFEERGRFVLHLDVNRPRSSSVHKFTNVNWYLDRLLSPLISHGISIAAIVWHEYE
jgi:hypothetical protein